ncbi:hypothetical protein TNCV_4174501 [Trichonephila clavipes]|nr:hypothetical protein TNCV_4174501 [Trichonephila clavipes]
MPPLGQRPTVLISVFVTLSAEILEQMSRSVIDRHFDVYLVPVAIAKPQDQLVLLWTFLRMPDRAQLVVGARWDIGARSRRRYDTTKKTMIHRVHEQNYSNN